MADARVTKEGDRLEVGHYHAQAGHFALLDLNEGERSWLLDADTAEALAADLRSMVAHIRSLSPDA